MSVDVCVFGEDQVTFLDQLIQKNRKLHFPAAVQTRGVNPGVKLDPGTRTRIELWRLCINSSIQQTVFPVSLLQPSSSSVVEVSPHTMILLLLLILPLSSLVMTSSLLTVVHRGERVPADKVCHRLETPDGGMTVRCSGQRLTQVRVWVFVVLQGPGLSKALWGLCFHLSPV